jgi:hypothetical protein
MTLKIRLSQKILSRTIIVLIVLVLLSGFGWFNSLVSYKYEVEDSVYAKQALNEHQKDIIFDIESMKVGFFCCLLLLVIALFFTAMSPTFNGRIYYQDKKGKADL